MLKGIDHTVYPVKDIDQEAEFLINELGFEVLWEFMGYIGFTNDIVITSEIERETPFTVYKVDSVINVVEEMKKSKGVSIIEEPTYINSGMKAAFQSSSGIEFHIVDNINL